MRKKPKYDKYLQDLGNGRMRTVAIIVYSKSKVVASCKEYDKGNEDKYISYYMQFQGSKCGVNELIKKAKAFYNVKDEQKIIEEK